MTMHIFPPMRNCHPVPHFSKGGCNSTWTLQPPLLLRDGYLLSRTFVLRCYGSSARSFMKLYETINLACSEHNNRLHSRGTHGKPRIVEPWRTASVVTGKMGSDPRGRWVASSGNKTDLYLQPSFKPFVTVRQRLFEPSRNQAEIVSRHYWKALIDCLAEIMVGRSAGTFRTDDETVDWCTTFVCGRAERGHYFI